MVIRADETHLRYSLQYPDHCIEIFAIQGFSPAFELVPHNILQAFAPCVQQPAG